MATTNKNTKKKQASGGSPRSYSEMYKSSAAGVTAVPAPAAASSGATASVAQPMRSSDQVDWKGEYGYVSSDLKRLGIITAVITGAIIVVGFFI